MIDEEYNALAFAEDARFPPIPSAWKGKLHSQKPAERWRAARDMSYAVTQMPPGEALAHLEAALQHPDVMVRRFAVHGLRRLGEAGVPLLCTALSNVDWETRWLAAEGLADTPDPLASAPLCAALHDRSSLVRVWAARALARLAEVAPSLELRAAIPRLRQLARAVWDVGGAVGEFGRIAGQIDAATRGLHDLPIPGRPGITSVDSLPLPSRGDGEGEPPDAGQDEQPW